MDPNPRGGALDMERRLEVEEQRWREERTGSPSFGERGGALGRETSGWGSAVEPIWPMKSLWKGEILGEKG